MSFIAATERRHWRTRVLYAVMYLVAIAGAATMVYPFLLMVSGSLKSAADFDEFEVIPAFLHDDQVLFRKWMPTRYHGNQARWQLVNGSMLQTWEEIPYPHDFSRQAAADVLEFIESPERCPWYFISLGQIWERGAQPRFQRIWRGLLTERFDGDLAAVNRAMGTNYPSWERVYVPEASLFYGVNRFAPDQSAVVDLYLRELRPTIPRHEFWPIHMEGIFYCFAWQAYEGDINRLNQRLGTSYASFEQIPLPRTYPAGQPLAPIWEQFIRERVLGPNPAFVRLRPSGRDAYLQALRTRHGTIEQLNLAYGTTFASFEAFPVPAAAPIDSAAGFADFQKFLDGGDCLPHIELDTFEQRWRAFLEEKYGTIEACAAAHGRAYASFETIRLDVAGYDAHVLLEHRGEMVWEFLTRNYRHVADFLFERGSAFRVTVLYVGLSVLLHLLINPLAAYALSRYKLRIGHWILLFCVLTMAFPAEVGSIPRFLLIRELGMLNTIWALVLPGVAHGFSIFILKSFFDGLPQELYEASLIEGASERWMFWNVTLALTKPILAVTAFGAFVSAYGAFLFALVIAPDERMWTISVWLYQFQQQVTDPVRFASLVVASVPVLAAFLLMQRFILRGIVLPVER